MLITPIIINNKSAISPSFHRCLFFQNQFAMKKSLALKLERTGASAPKHKLNTRLAEGNTLSKPGAKASLKIDVPSNHHGSPENKSAKTPTQTNYRNKNLSVLPASLLNTLSSLSSLDISHNKLSDSQIELLMNSCPKLETLCIQGNLTSLIPVSIWKLKNLQKFRHDWVKIFPDQPYESTENLKNIKAIIRKPNMVTKSHGVVGMNFQCYCLQVIKIEMDSKLLEKVQQIKCSHFSQNFMIQSIRFNMNEGELQTKGEIQVIDNGKRDNPIIAGCFTICGFDLQKNSKPKQQKWRQLPSKKQSKSQQNQTKEEESPSNIKIQKVREIRQTQKTNYTSHSEIPDLTYKYKDMPLHMLLSKYDRSAHGSIDMDRLLLKGYNPNTYDHSGLSPYHIVVIFRQEKALERLMEIAFKNPGFFDLEMPSMKEGRNILHYSVFLKDYPFTKFLLDFGLPLDKRDFNGARLIHLVDQNYEFLLLLRKALRKRYQRVMAPSFISYPQPMSKKYSRHPPRVAQEANYQIYENKNVNLMQMYQAAVGRKVNRQ